MLQKLIAADTDGDLTNLNNGKGVPLSADLNYILKKVKVKKARVFGSATWPLLLPFEYIDLKDEEETIKEFTMMFKTGDDMR